MTTITIPNKINNKDLVAIPRIEYEKLSRLASLIPEEQIWFWTKEWQLKESQADKDIKAGRVSGPYSNKAELKQVLAGLKTKK